MDNFKPSESKLAEGKDFYRNTKLRFLANFNISKWKTNDKELRNQFDAMKRVNMSGCETNKIDKVKTLSGMNGKLRPTAWFFPLETLMKLQIHNSGKT